MDRAIHRSSDSHTRIDPVSRNGIRQKILSSEIVPQDWVLLGPNLVIPADGYLEESQGIQIDESVLTGESLPVKKRNEDPESVVFAGTRVLTETGILRVLRTGPLTQYGQIVQSISQAPKERTPLQKTLQRLVQILIGAPLGLCALLAIARIKQGHGWIDALMSSATLAIAAIPEEFPVVFTFYLGVGVYRLAKRKALVRRGVSVENIG